MERNDISESISALLGLSFCRIRQIIGKNILALERQGPHLPSLEQIIFLYLRNRATPASLNDVAEFLSCSKQQTSKIVDRLVEKKLIDRRVNPKNRREVCLELSSLGKETIESLLSIQEKRVQDILSPLSDEDLKELYDSAKSIERIVKDNKLVFFDKAADSD